MGVLSRISESQDAANKNQVRAMVVNSTQDYSNCKEEIMKKYTMTRTAMKRDVKHLREWASKHPSFGSRYLLWMTEEWLESYLVISKNSLARAKQLIELYWRGRIVCSEVYADRHPRSPSIQSSFDNLSISVSRGMTSTCYRICCVRFEKQDDSEFDILSFLKRTTLILDAILKEGMDFAGFVFVFDLTNFSLSHFKRLNFNSLSILQAVMKSYPISLAKIYKVQTRMELSTPERLVEEYRTDLLPSDYHGSEGTLGDLSRRIDQRLLKVGDKITAMDNIVFDKINTPNHLDVSISSSFRRLEID